MDVIMPTIYSFVACIAFCIILQISPRSILPVAVGGGISCFAYMLLNGMDNAVVQSFIGGVCASAYSEIMAHKRKVPVTTHLIIGIIPLVPGGMIYAAMEYCLAGDMDAFLRTALATFGVAGAIALSMLITSSVMKIFFRDRGRS